LLSHIFSTFNFQRLHFSFSLVLQRAEQRAERLRTQSRSFRGSEPENVLVEPSLVGVYAELRLFAVSEDFFDATCLVEIRILGVLKIV
jgi:hypothetical protein